MKNGYKLTIKSAAVAFCTSKQTIEKCLRAMDVQIVPRQEYPIHEIHRALSGDVKYERARLVREQADAQALENQRVRGELISLEDARRVGLQPWAAVNDSLLAMPHALCARVNPSDPEHSRPILQEWSDQTRRLIHDKFLMGGEPEIPTGDPEEESGA